MSEFVEDATGRWIEIEDFLLLIRLNHPMQPQVPHKFFVGVADLSVQN